MKSDKEIYDCICLKLEFGERTKKCANCSHEIKSRCNELVHHSLLLKIPF